MDLRIKTYFPLFSNFILISSSWDLMYLDLVLRYSGILINSNKANPIFLISSI